LLLPLFTVVFQRKDTSSTSLHINIYFLTVADMCKSSSATEHSDHSGSYKVDSVVLHIMIQQENCICRVTIDNQI